MILLVNGPNLNLLGEREPQLYGATALADIERMVSKTCAAHGVEVRAFQSNHEGAIIDFLQEHRHEAQGVIFNPGAFTHTSYALHDCLKALACPKVEVHLTNIHAREEWRHRSVIAPAMDGQIAGLGPTGYTLAAVYVCGRLPAKAQPVLTDPEPVQGEPAEGEREAPRRPAATGDYE